MITSTSENVTAAIAALQEMTPAPMNSMLEKQPKEVAVKKREERRSMVVKDVLPTTPGKQNCFYTNIIFIITGMILKLIYTMYIHSQVVVTSFAVMVLNTRNSH